MNKNKHCSECMYFKQEHLYTEYFLELYHKYLNSKKRKIDVKNFLRRTSYNIIRGIINAIQDGDSGYIDDVFNSISFHNHRTIVNSLCSYFDDEESYYEFFDGKEIELPIMSYDDFMVVLNTVALRITHKEPINVLNISGEL